jgi:hypothetical protein
MGNIAIYCGKMKRTGVDGKAVHTPYDVRRPSVVRSLAPRVTDDAVNSTLAIALVVAVWTALLCRR